MLLISTPRPSRTARRRDFLYRLVTRLLSVALLPLAVAAAPQRARQVACQWALAARFPAENLDGLTPATRAAFEAARTEALWRHGELDRADRRLPRRARPGAAVRRRRAPNRLGHARQELDAAAARVEPRGRHRARRAAGRGRPVARAARVEASSVPRLRQRVVALRVPAGRPAAASAEPGGVSHARALRDPGRCGMIPGMQRDCGPVRVCSGRRAGVAVASARAGRRGRLPLPRRGRVAAGGIPDAGVPRHPFARASFLARS